MSAPSERLNAKLFDNIERLKEDGSNWDVWKMQVTLVLEHRGLIGYAEGKKTRPTPIPPSPSGKSTSGSASGSGSTPTNEAAIEEWDKANREALIQIVLTLEREVAALVTGKSLASEAWTTIKNRFDGRGIQSVAYLMTKLWRSTMTLDRELLPQIQEVKECAQRLKSPRSMKHSKPSLPPVILPRHWNRPCTPSRHTNSRGDETRRMFSLVELDL